MVFYFGVVLSCFLVFIDVGLFLTQAIAGWHLTEVAESLASWGSEDPQNVMRQVRICPDMSIIFNCPRWFDSQPSGYVMIQYDSCVHIESTPHVSIASFRISSPNRLDLESIDVGWFNTSSRIIQYKTHTVYSSFTVIFSQSFIVIIIQSYLFLFILVHSYSLTYSICIICYPTLSCLFVVSCIRMFILNYYSSSNFVYVQKIFRSKLVSFTPGGTITRCWSSATCSEPWTMKNREVCAQPAIQHLNENIKRFQDTRIKVDKI